RGHRPVETPAGTRHLGLRQRRARADSVERRPRRRISAHSVSDRRLTRATAVPRRQLARRTGSDEQPDNLLRRRHAELFFSRRRRRRLAPCCFSSNSITWRAHDVHHPVLLFRVSRASSFEDGAMNIANDTDLKYSDGIAAARTMIAVEGNHAALQHRLPRGWQLAPYAGDDLRGSSLQGANLLIPFHEVYAIRTHDGHTAGLPQVSYIAFVSQARHLATGRLAHIHWLTYTEDPSAVPGKYRDGKLAAIKRSQTFTKERRGETDVRETFSAVAESGAVNLSLAYAQGGMVMWATADTPNLPLYAAADPTILRSYQEDQVLNVV